MEEKIAEAVGRYFDRSRIEEIKIFGRRAIITLMTDKDEPEKQRALKAELEQLPELDKVSVIFTAVKRRPDCARKRKNGRYAALGKLSASLREKAGSANRRRRSIWRWLWLIAV